jgi:hypothetical protein
MGSTFAHPIPPVLPSAGQTSPSSSSSSPYTPSFPISPHASAQQPLRSPSFPLSPVPTSLQTSVPTKRRSGTLRSQDVIFPTMKKNQSSTPSSPQVPSHQQSSNIHGGGNVSSVGYLTSVPVHPSVVIMDVLKGTPAPTVPSVQQDVQVCDRVFVY